MMAQAASLADRLPRQLSFKHTVQIWIAWTQHAKGIDHVDKLYGLFVLIAQQHVGERPGRIEPRALKRRPRPYRYSPNRAPLPVRTSKNMVTRKSLSKCHSPQGPVSKVASAASALSALAAV